MVKDTEKAASRTAPEADDEYTSSENLFTSDARRIKTGQLGSMVKRGDRVFMISREQAQILNTEQGKVRAHTHTRTPHYICTSS